MNHQTEKMYVKQLIKLKQQEMLIEKSLEYFFNNMKYDTDIVQNVIQECKHLDDERNKIESLLRHKIFEIDSDFETIRSIMNRLENGQSIDINNCHKKMKELLEKIEHFSVKSELEILEKQQKEFDIILNEFKENLSKYNTRQNSLTNKFKVSKSRPNSKEIDNDSKSYDEINDFHSLVVKTGHTQHWTEKDHIYFQNVRKKCSSIPALVAKIQKQCPDLSAEKIVNHEAWYKIYLTLREKQRISVNEWRKQKELEKKQKMDMIKNIEMKKNDTGTIEFKCEQRINDNNYYISANNKSKVILSSKEIDTYLDDKKELIKQWRVQKENAKIADEERLKRQADAIRVTKEKKFLMHSVKIRDAVAKYKEKKNEIRLKLSSTSNLENKIIKSSALIKSLRKRDEEFLNRRKYLKEIKNKNSKINHYNIVVTDNGPRPINQSTLMKPTKIWNEKCNRKYSLEQSPRPIFYIKDLPRLSLHNCRNQTSISFV